MFKKVPVIAACLIMACGIEAWGAEAPSARTSRSAVMQSPARDGAYVLELPGLVNGIFLGDRVQFDTGREWLVIRVRWKQSGSTARTHLELADPTYADLYG